MPEDHVIIKLDLRTHSIHCACEAMLEAVEYVVPELYRFVYSAYTIELLLQYGNDTVKSREGPQQGDPLGPLMFCTTIKPLLSLLQSELRIGFQDDLTIGGQVDIITRDVELIKREVALLGLQLTEAKCEIICPNDSSATYKPEFADFISTPVHEMRLLGAPLVMPGGKVTKVEIIVSSTLSALNDIRGDYVT